MIPLRSVAFFFASALTAAAGDWLQFRGPGGSGVSPDAQIPAEPKIQWSVDLPGRGLSTPIVVGEKLFVTASSGPKQERLHVICFRAKDGARLWERQLRATGRTMTHPKTSVAASSPCSDGKHIYALWSSNDLAAFDLEGGLLWVRGLTADYPNVSNSLGMASSPIVVGETVVAVVENDSESYTVGVDARTGRNIWKLDRPKAANWSSPVVWRAKDGAPPVVVLQSSKGLLAVDPATGSKLWEYTEGASTTSSSVAVGNIIYAASNGITALAPQANNAPPEQLWRARQISPATISPVVVNGVIVSLNSAGVLTTADIKTGTNAWKLRTTGPYSASPVAAGSRLLLVSEKGLVQVVETAGDEPKITGTLQLPLKAETKELILSTPSLSGEHAFVRTDSTLWRVGP